MKKLKTILQSKATYLILLFLALFISIMNTKVIKNYSIFNEEEKDFIGIITNYKIDGNKLSMTIKTDKKEKLQSFYYINSEEEKELLKNKIKYGITLKISGSLESPSVNTIPNTFNYKEYLKNKEIFYLLNISKFDVIKEENLINKIKNGIVKYIDNITNSNYLKAFILGDKSNIDEDVFENYRQNGVTHLFAISGMHISVFALVLKKLLSKSNLKDKYINIIIIFFLLFYGFITGFQSSIKRALTLYILIVINKSYNLKIDTIYLLYLTAFILIIINNYIIYDIGFQYSFVTSYGLILCSKNIEKNNKLLELLKTSLISFAFSLPLTLFYFYEVNLFSIINNSFFIPWVSFIVYPICLLTLLIPFLNIILTPILTLTEFITTYLGSHFVFNILLPINLKELFIYYIILILCIKINKKFLFLLILELSFIKILPLIDKNAYVYFIDVGQGDSTLIISPYRKDIILIDTGGTINYPKEDWQIKNKEYHLGDNLITFFKSIGISKLDRLIISHGDNDHMGEAINIVNSFKVEKVILNCGSYNDLEQKLIKVLDKNKIPYSSCIKELDIDNSKLYFLQTKEYDNENDNSNVIYTKINGYKFMFMGDAGKIVEKNILDKYNSLNTDVLKVGHHGSKTSSSKNFINEINPKYGIIPVGKNNRYGHPNNEVLDNLKDTTIFRTDIDGSIMFKIKKNKLEIETCTP